jgi:gluconate 2-dehydrogenase gamma chain
MADNEGVGRRGFLKDIGLTGTAVCLATANAAPVTNEAQAQPGTRSHAHAPAPARNDNTADVFRFLTVPEAAVLIALVDTLMPKDDVDPGGVEVGVPTFIDCEMANAYGCGARIYLDGPFGECTPQQGLPVAAPTRSALPRRHR